MQLNPGVGQAMPNRWWVTQGVHNSTGSSDPPGARVLQPPGACPCSYGGLLPIGRVFTTGGHQCGDMAAAALLPFTGRPTLRHSRSRRFSGHSSLSRVTGAPRPSFPTLLQQGLVTPVAFAMCSSYGWPTCREADPNSSFQKRRGSFRRRILIMNRLPNSTVLPNKALHLTRREGAVASRPVIEARLAGERRCCTGHR